MRIRDRVLGVAGLAAGITLLAGTAAQAAVPPANGTVETVTAAGSDTIQDVTNALLADFQGGTSNPDPDKFRNIPSLPTAPFTVDGDSHCATINYTQAPATAPNRVAPDGSGAGKTALTASVAAGDGCIDIARSSSARAASDPATFEYYAFARDGVSWAAYTGGHAPAGLTLTQLQQIYRCDVRDWSAVGGTAGTIIRYLPQVNSGTLAFFQSNVLGFTPPETCSDGSTIKRIQENTGNTVPAADKTNAIMPYSVAQWVAQGNGVVTDRRSTVTERTLAGTNPVTGAAPNFAPNFPDTFIGARKVYHVLDRTSVSYAAALRAVGFSGLNNSPLCNGDKASILSQYGFKPLPKVSGHNCTKE